MSRLVQKNDALGFLVLVVTSIVYGLYPVATRVAYKDGANAAFILFFTLLVRALGFDLFCLVRGEGFLRTKERAKWALTGGAWQAVSATSVITALTFLPAPLVIIIVFTYTLMLLFFMAWKREIRLDVSSIFSTIGALAGLTLVLDIWEVQPTANWIGFGFAFLGAVATMSRIYVYGKQTKTCHPAAVGGENFSVAFFLALPFIFWHGLVPPGTEAGWICALFAFASTLLGSFGMLYGLALLDSFRWSLFSKIEPIFTCLFSALLAREYLKTPQYLGIVLVVGSLAFYQVSMRRRDRKKLAATVAVEP